MKRCYEIALYAIGVALSAWAMALYAEHPGLAAAMSGSGLGLVNAAGRLHTETASKES